ncbi:MAG: non-hydrolyzing UDP-N-acetylglucosamine 2-epimerase, partial [Alphaproteobacteria bacterium]
RGNPRACTRSLNTKSLSRFRKALTMLPEVHLVAAARPNLPKLAALWHALAAGPEFCKPVLLHTGQHEDQAMFGVHFADLGLPAPDIALGISGGSHAVLTGRSMIACETVWKSRRPAAVVVAGDVDGALAAALAARKMGVTLIHLEAGLRSGERNLPEEINRRAIDAISDILWAPDEITASRLRQEGHSAAAVRAVGNAMVDTQLRHLPAARARRLPRGLSRGGYGVVTLHRAGNVDKPERYIALLEALSAAARHVPLVWPIHPRAAAQMKAFGVVPPMGGRITPPLGYLEFLSLLCRARLVATDSGGVQEEATALGLPCLTLRGATERPITIASGMNRLATPEELPLRVAEILSTRAGAPRPVPLWDGRAGIRMREHLQAVLEGEECRAMVA